MRFEALGLSEPLLKAVADQGYDEPSPIQTKGIPLVLEGEDVMAAAQTGTGKTAAFTLPILEYLSTQPKVRANHAKVLVLAPTRELAAQINESVKTYSKYLQTTSAVVFGGVKINPQMMALRKGVDILVATPGRLLDLYNQNAVKFSDIEVLILDEADRMLDMGFIHDIKRVISYLPKERQTLMFSATFSDDIRNLAKGLLKRPVEISVTPRNAAATTVEQFIYSVDKKQKPALLAYLIKKHDWKQVLVFSRTKHGANRLAKFLNGREIQASAIHGNKSQGARTRALAEFKSGECRILVATDIAARGLDIDQLPQVVNIDLPHVPEDYVHRIGRTGRAGMTGQAISLVCADEVKQLFAIERLINKEFDRKIHDSFAPVNELPPSDISRYSSRKKKPKKPKAPKDFDTSESPSQNSRRPRRTPKSATTDKPRSNSNKDKEIKSEENAPKQRKKRYFRPKKTGSYKPS
ncbi:MAG: DEAD/DEAH box helicase [Candidatus Cloacimonetes bacterium]|nr:DEAD/DEAH box helicase [Candidatus Cloacimonadota bacterium]